MHVKISKEDLSLRNQVGCKWMQIISWDLDGYRVTFHPRMSMGEDQQTYQKLFKPKYEENVRTCFVI